MGSCSSKTSAVSTVTVRDYSSKIVKESPIVVTKVESIEANAEPSVVSEKIPSPSPSPDLFDMTPQNDIVANYCKRLVNVIFHGCDVSMETPEPEEDPLKPSDPADKRWAKLAVALKATDAFIRTHPAELDVENELFNSHLQVLMRARDSTHGCNTEYHEKFLKDAQNFVKIYNKRGGGVSQEMDHDDYWADRQQLLSGKVIADHIDEEYGPMDPVFGVLLSPVAGRVGSGDNDCMHDLLFDKDGRYSYHGAVHDAFGYLVTHHDVGPGYNYTGGWTLMDDTDNPLAGQLSGMDFWGNTLEELQDATPQVVL